MPQTVWRGHHDSLVQVLRIQEKSEPSPKPPRTAGTDLAPGFKSTPEGRNTFLLHPKSGQQSPSDGKKWPYLVFAPMYLLH